MNDERTKQEQAQEQEVPKAIPMEEQIRTRIILSIQDDIDRLEGYAARMKRMPDGQGSRSYCQAIESIAAIKVKAETSLIQIEMAAKTAAVAAQIGNMVRGQKGAGTPGEKTPGPNIRDLANKVASPGAPAKSQKTD